MAGLSDNVIAYLTTWSDAFEQFYRPGVGDYLKRFGKTTRMIPKNPKRRVIGSSMEVTMKTRKNRSARITNDLLAPPPDPGPGAYTTYKVRFDAETAASNDFSALQIGFRTHWYDIKKRTDATFKDSMGDFIRQDIEDGLQDVAEEFAGSFHYGKNQKLATISAVKDNNSDRYDSAQAYQAGATVVLVKLSATAIAHIADGELVDLYNNTDNAFEAKSARIVNVNPVDYTVVLAIETSPAATVDNGGSALANWNALDSSITAGDTVEVYLSGVLTGGSTETAPTMKGSLDNFFDPSQDYFNIAAANRLNATYRTLMPVRIDAAAGGSAVQLTEDHFRQAGEAVGWANGSYLDTDKRVIVMNRDQYRAVNLLQKDSGMTILPALQSEVGKEMNKAFGFDGWTMHDPTLGSVALSVDDMATYGVIDFLDMSTWEMVEPFPGGQSFEFMPGQMAKIWNRVSYNNASTNQNYNAKYDGRPSKEFEAQGEQLYAWINVGPKRNVRLMGLDTTL
tara:strand:- start:3082 stop:4605 length:1524 start_codon:yes stop_codon:yes gene_type:complete